MGNKSPGEKASGADWIGAALEALELTHPSKNAINTGQM
jgi:hypothetical protein